MSLWTCAHVVHLLLLCLQVEYAHAQILTALSQVLCDWLGSIHSSHLMRFDKCIHVCADMDGTLTVPCIDFQEMRCDPCKASYKSAVALAVVTSNVQSRQMGPCIASHTSSA